MSSLNVEQLLEPISPDQPCGENLEYDADFGELERAAQPKPEQEYGKTKVEAEEPDWRDVRDRAIEIFGRTKDIRVASYLARAVLRTDGLNGFRDSLVVIRGLIEKYWKELHPLLDPEDDLDPALRVNSVATLCNKDACLWALTETPLVTSPLGQTSFRDYLIALGELPPRAGQEKPEMSVIESAFSAADGGAVLAALETAQGAVEDVVAIESAMTQEVGYDRTVGLDPLSDLFRRMAKLLDEQVERLGLRKPPPEEEVAAEAGEEYITDGTSGDTAAESGEAAVRVAKVAFDRVQSRDDVIRLLDKICDYYRDFEPSSPVPLLLRRAKRVATMDFLELLRELAPAGLAEVELLKGTADGDAAG
jgi:type VI secretion system protein ImpA